MSEVEVKISSERIDDIPLIVEWLKRIEIAKYIDQKLKKPHGNHQGMSYGQLSVLLLTYIITQSDHRLCAVEAWVETHRKILELTTGWLIGEKDASDDRLAKVTEELGKQSLAREEIEIKLGRQIIRAYELPTKIARTDTTSFSVNHENQRDTEEEIKNVFLCSSPIDVVSVGVYVLAKTGAYPSMRTMFMVANDPNNLPLEFLKNCHRVVLAFNNDEQGEKTTNAVLELLPSGQRFKPNYPDWNQELKAHFYEAELERERQSRSRGFSL